MDISKVFLSAFFLLYTIGYVTTDDVIVETDNGPIRGSLTSQARQFLGIPFAVPPIGENRWRSPKKALPWSPKILNATSPGPACPQKYCYKYLPPHNCPKKTSEDCLYLNVWTPLDASVNSTYPVMVFIHGGAFSWGYANARGYDGNNLTQRGDVILVTLDYRLGVHGFLDSGMGVDDTSGVLGFLYSGEGEDDAHGNMAIEDQRLALQWVKDNINSFGGDTQRITLFGQSAGAQSTFIHMMSAASSGLFRSAIVESAPYFPYRTKPEALAILEIVARHLDCPKRDMACLRSKTTDEVNDAQEVARFRLSSFKVDNYFEYIGPILDSVNVVMDPMQAASEGLFAKIPVIIGTVSEECIYFVYAADKEPLPRAGYDAAVLVLRRDDFAKIEKEYPPPDNDTDCRDALSVLGTDYLFTCAVRNVTRNIVKDVEHVYRYIFDHASKSHGSWENFTFCEDHVCHAEELGYVFQNHIGMTPTKEDNILSETMSAAWTNFAYTSDPNVGPHTLNLTWPVYSPKANSVMHFITPKSEIIKEFRTDYCDFWDKIGYELDNRD